MLARARHAKVQDVQLSDRKVLGKGPRDGLSTGRASGRQSVRYCLLVLGRRSSGTCSASNRIEPGQTGKEVKVGNRA